MSARKYIRDARGRFAFARGQHQQKAAKKRAGKITKHEAKARQHSAKARLSESRFGFTAHSEYHQGRSMKSWDKAGKAQTRNRRKGYNRAGEKTGPAIGRIGDYQKTRKSKAAYQKRKVAGLKAQAATGITPKQAARQRAAAKRAAQGK